MNWALVRRDVAMRYVGRWMFVGPAVTLTFMGVIASIRFAGGPGAPRTAYDVPLVLLTLWLPTALYVWVSATERRCSRFDMELPISSRELWAAHSAALVLAGLLVLAASAAVLAFASWVVEVWTGLFPPVFEAGDLRLAVPVITMLLLSVALAQSVSASLERIPGGHRTAWAIVASIVLGYFACLALSAMPLAVSLLPAAVAAWLCWRTFTEMPGTMVVAPLRPGWFDGVAPRRAQSAAGAARETLNPVEWEMSAPRRSAAGRLWMLAATIFRSTTKMPIAPIVGLPFLLAAGFTMSGALGSAIRGDDSIRFSMLFIIAYLFLSFSGLPPRRLHMVDAFPVSRRFIFAVMFVPYIVTLGLGYGAGRAVADRSENGHELIRFLELEGHQYVSAPLRYGAIAWDGKPPETVAPWGESHDVWSTPLWRGSTAVVHAKYSTPPGSSTEFVAWQIGRAVKDIYGEDISTDAIEQRYLTLDADGQVAPVGGALTLAADHPDWKMRPYGPVFPVMTLFVCGLWLLALRFYLGRLRPGFTEKSKRGAFWGGMVVLMALHLVQFAAIFGQMFDHWVLSGASMIAIRALAEWLPGGSFAVWVLCAAALYGIYHLAERRFERVESLPGDDMRVALLERPIGAAGQEGAYAR